MILIKSDFASFWTSEFCEEHSTYDDSEIVLKSDKTKIREDTECSEGFFGCGCLVEFFKKSGTRWIKKVSIGDTTEAEDINVYLIGKNETGCPELITFEFEDQTFDYILSGSEIESLKNAMYEDRLSDYFC